MLIQTSMMQPNAKPQCVSQASILFANAVRNMLTILLLIQNFSYITVYIFQQATFALWEMCAVGSVSTKIKQAILEGRRVLSFGCIAFFHMQNHRDSF